MVGGPGKAVCVTMSGLILQGGHCKIEYFTGVSVRGGSG